MTVPDSGQGKRRAAAERGCYRRSDRTRQWRDGRPARRATDL